MLTGAEAETLVYEDGMTWLDATFLQGREMEMSSRLRS